MLEEIINSAQLINDAKRVNGTSVKIDFRMPNYIYSCILHEQRLYFIQNET